MISAIIAYTMMGSADKGWIIYAAGPFAALAGLYGPALTNMMSSRISASEQGELQGAIGAAQGLALMIGPFLMAGMFSRYGNSALKDSFGLAAFPDNILRIAGDIFGGMIPYVPGAPFIMAASLALIAFATYCFVTTKADRQARMSDAKTEPATEEATPAL